MTEDEAKTKWCPMIGLPSSKCLASVCAMWRFEQPIPVVPPRLIVWPETEDIKILTEGEPDRPSYVSDGYDWVPAIGKNNDDVGARGGYWIETEAHRDLVFAEKYSKRHGYCGLAGKFVS